MARYTRKEFCDLTGVTRGYLSTYIGRGEVIEKKGLIDDSEPKNRLFVDKRVDRKEKPAVDTEQPKKTTEVSMQHRAGSSSLTEAKLRKEWSIIAKNEHDLKIKEFELQKKRGELVPVTDMHDLVLIFKETIQRRFHDAADNMITLIKEKYEISSADAAAYREEVVTQINKAIAEAIDQSKKSIRKAAKELSEQRGAGEKEIA